jgi:hypothetical protein
VLLLDLPLLGGSLLPCGSFATLPSLLTDPHVEETPRQSGDDRLFILDRLVSGVTFQASSMGP